MSRAARADCGARFWSPGAPCSTRCGRSRTWSGLSCARPASSSARPPAAAFAGRVRELAGDDRAVMPIVQPLLAILDTMLAELARLTKQVLGLARNEEVCRRLMTVPGVGPITALTFRASRPAGPLQALAGRGCPSRADAG